MHKILAKIRHHQKLLNKAYECTKPNITYIRELVLATHIELDEFINELPWKPWKPIESQPFNLECATEELADVFIFAFNLWVALESYIEKDLQATINSKIDKNVKRLLTGFHTTRQTEGD